MSIKEKLSALGLTLPTAAAPVAAYVPAVKSGNLVFTAGQLPVVDGKLVKEGKVGSDVSANDAKELDRGLGEAGTRTGCYGMPSGKL